MALPRALIVPLVLTGTVLAGCASGDGGAPSASISSSSTTALSNTVPSTTVPSTTVAVPPTTPPGHAALTDDTAAGPGSHVLQFEVASEVGCSGDTVDVTVTYRTEGVEVVAFALDGASATGGAAPTSGTRVVTVPCDDRAHTIMLIGSTPTGPVFASEAVVTRRT